MSKDNTDNCGKKHLAWAGIIVTIVLAAVGGAWADGRSQWRQTLEQIEKVSDDVVETKVQIARVETAQTAMKESIARLEN